MNSPVLKSTRVATILLSLVLVLPGVSFAQAVEEQPSALAMTADLAIARPLLLVTTAVGAVFYVVSLPFSLSGGNAKAAGDTLVAKPGKATFVRCLGCKQSGYNQDISD
ncbi:MAG: hypothetical protein ACR2PS_18120 [Pseudomonadales bacterium]